MFLPAVVVLQLAADYGVVAAACNGDVADIVSGARTHGQRQRQNDDLPLTAVSCLWGPRRRETRTGVLKHALHDL